MQKNSTQEIKVLFYRTLKNWLNGIKKRHVFLLEVERQNVFLTLSLTRCVLFEEIELISCCSLLLLVFDHCCGWVAVALAPTSLPSTNVLEPDLFLVFFFLCVIILKKMGRKEKKKFKHEKTFGFLIRRERGMGEFLSKKNVKTRHRPVDTNDTQSHKSYSSK